MSHDTHSENQKKEDEVFNSKAENQNKKSTPDTDIEGVSDFLLPVSSSIFAIVAKNIAEIILPPPLFSFRNILSGERNKKEKNLEEKKTKLVKELLASEIDPQTFDILLENEIDRRLKVKFGITFLCFTFIFTATSYAIVVLDGVYSWGISEGAITALIIETPIQFIGLLYIIARNLFPQTSMKDRVYRNDKQSNKKDTD